MRISGARGAAGNFGRAVTGPLQGRYRPLQGRYRAVTGPLQGRYRAVTGRYRAVTGPLQGRSEQRVQGRKGRREPQKEPADSCRQRGQGAGLPQVQQAQLTAVTKGSGRGFAMGASWPAARRSRAHGRHQRRRRWLRGP